MVYAVEGLVEVAVGDVIQEYEKMLDCRFFPRKAKLTFIDHFGHKVNNSIVDQDLRDGTQK